MLIMVAFVVVPRVGAEGKQPKVLIVYHINADNEEQKEEIHILDLLIGHFTSDITIKSTAEIAKEKSMNDFTHVFFLGSSRKTISNNLISLFDHYNGSVFYIGNHVEQFHASSFLKWNKYEDMRQLIDGKNVVDLKSGKSALNFSLNKDVEVYYKGKSEQDLSPLIFKRGAAYYMTSESISEPLSGYLGETLFDFFDVERGIPKKYLRLEDVHPKSNPKKLKEIAEYLKEQDIPYMVTVIPVYINPETGEEVHLSDAKRVVAVLQYMQDNGGSIVMHGYHHQYRDTETGEGFEYWDVLNDRPIYQDKDEKVLFRDDFKTDEEYEAYISDGLKFEQNYIESTVEKGVTELVQQGLYPLGFEAPHYTMSLSGYKELSNYFSTYVGQIQISDETYKATYIPFYTSEPAMLYGMKVLPETLGYIDRENQNAVAEMLQKAGYTSGFSDSYLAFFYHPYLGLNRLKGVVQEMKIYHDDWVDLKKVTNKVDAGGIVIESKDGEITVDRPIKMVIMAKIKTMWWFAIPLLISILIIVSSIKARKR